MIYILTGTEQEYENWCNGINCSLVHYGLPKIKQDIDCKRYTNIETEIGEGDAIIMYGTYYTTKEFNHIKNKKITNHKEIREIK